MQEEEEGGEREENKEKKNLFISYFQRLGISRAQSPHLVRPSCHITDMVEGDGQVCAWGESRRGGLTFITHSYRDQPTAIITSSILGVAPL
jgi:hypothetical protein